MKNLLIVMMVVLILPSKALSDPSCTGVNFGSGNTSCDHYYIVPAHSGLVAFYKEIISSDENCDADSWVQAFEKYHQKWFSYMSAKCVLYRGVAGWGNESCEIEEMINFNKGLLHDLSQGFYVGEEFYARDCEVKKQELSPGFNCTKQLNSVEEMVCDDLYLSIYDRRLNNHYIRAKQQAKNPEKIKDEQTEWLEERNKCEDKYCLLYLYFHRVNSFKKNKDQLWWE